MSSDEDDERRLQLVEDGIVAALGRLSESYSEDMQNDIARCFCNLAHATETPSALVKSGALQILMLVGTMRASAVTTRRCVAQALWNICTPSTLEALIASGDYYSAQKARRAPATCASSTDISAMLVPPA